MFKLLSFTTGSSPIVNIRFHIEFFIFYHFIYLKRISRLILYTISKKENRRKKKGKKKKEKERKIPKKEFLHAHIQSIYLIQALVSSVQV